MPDEPDNEPEALFIFTGLQSDDWVPIVGGNAPPGFDIIQPVLRYPANSGYGWSAQSWFVTLDIGYLVSNEIVFRPVVARFALAQTFTRSFSSLCCCFCCYGCRCNAGRHSVWQHDARRRAKVVHQFGQYAHEGSNVDQRRARAAHVTALGLYDGRMLRLRWWLQLFANEAALVHRLVCIL